ncbi:hypothetical protein [Vibrio quintilis]|uniref:Uncharacterized protein n=1 Tax=Vibrio quintilis TaxID=1117707 RepID=A0A1M7Z348_9VIBR|nr:hypothetical protein [Vibrio quintilis]SHO59076.1 hypothetical protein VQ7734_04852 [Vibrio quintilis]
MPLSESEVKKIWQRLQDEILGAHHQVNKRLCESQTPQAFLNYLSRHHLRTNHFEPVVTSCKLGQYGKTIVVGLLFVENGFLYPETAYYPMSLQRFGTRISVDAADSYSSHYMERLIQRKEVTTLEALKKEVIYQRDRYSSAGFSENLGKLNVDTDFLVIFPDAIICCYGEENDEGIAKVVRKTLITQDDFIGNQQKIIDYILKQFGRDACILATHALPRSVKEAQNAVEDTLKRISVVNHVEKIIEEPLRCTGFKSDKKLKKQFIKYLEHFDPIFR